jgi:hypothetical protein
LSRRNQSLELLARTLPKFDSALNSLTFLWMFCRVCSQQLLRLWQDGYLMKSRQIETNVSKDTIAESCLLCSEETPDRCHRRLVAE